MVEGGYGLSRVVHGVTLRAGAGEVVSLLGRNGAGKSTTLKSVVGLVEVTGGHVRFDGRDTTVSKCTPAGPGADAGGAGLRGGG